MADAIYSGTRAHDKTIPILPAGLSPANFETVHPGIVGNALVSPDEQIALLSLLDEQGGYAPLGDCLAALPDHPRPVAALIALAEAGVVVFDPEAAFDAHCIVRRVTPASA